MFGTDCQVFLDFTFSFINNLHPRNKKPREIEIPFLMMKHRLRLNGVYEVCCLHSRKEFKISWLQYNLEYLQTRVGDPNSFLLIHQNLNFFWCMARFKLS